ncbi:MAG: hypothetical protein ABI333_18425 [bacterium]
MHKARRTTIQGTITGATLLLFAASCGGEGDSKSKKKDDESKPSCKLLFKRYKKCDKMPLTEEAFLGMCEKMIVKGEGRAKTELECSVSKECPEFKKCLKDAQKKSRANRMKKRWMKAKKKAEEGDYGSVMTFCEIWKDDLTDEIKKECDGMAGQVVGKLMKDITAKRDAGKVSYKEVKCWDLKRYAKKAGADALKAAETLCHEIALGRDVKSANESIEKQLKKDSPYLPYQCNKRTLDKFDKLGTPFAKQQKALLIDACFKKLGKVILEKKVPKQKYGCRVQSVYRGIKEHKISTPEIDKLMAQAAKKCDKK